MRRRNGLAIQPDVKAYLQSISGELESKANRIRNLIGDSHFLSDGHHKEYVLQTVLENFLPSGYICSRGFVVRDSNLQYRSTEQDLLIVDCKMHSPLFMESGVIVTFPENVRAAISVKTTIDPSSVADALKGLNSIPVISSVSPFWRGIFGFQMGDSWRANAKLAIKWLKSNTSDKKGTQLSSWACGAICCSSNMFITIDANQDAPRIRGYRTKLSTALFVAELVDHIAAQQKTSSRGINDLLGGMEFEKIDN